MPVCRALKPLAPASGSRLFWLLALCTVAGGCKEEQSSTGTGASPTPGPTASATPSPTSSATPTPTPSPTPTPTITHYHVGGAVSNLNGALTLSVTDANGVNPVTLTQNGAFVLPDSYVSGESFDVAVMTVPPHQACDIQYGVSVVGQSNVNNMVVTCINTNTLSISLDVYGITTADTLSVGYGGSSVQVTQAPIAEHLDPNTPYAITLISPAGYDCTSVANDLVGNMPSADLVVQIDCAMQAYGVTFSATGLLGGESISVLDHSGSSGNHDAVVLTPSAASAAWMGNANYAQPLALALGSASNYLSCAFANAQNTFSTHMPAAALAVPITCTHKYDLSGAVSGLYNGAAVTLDLNGNTQVVQAAAPTFAFAGGVPGGGNWMLTVAVQPPDQLCTVDPNAGTQAGGSVTGVAVSCVPFLTFSTQQNATVVIGQPNFAADGSGAGTDNLSWGQVYGSPTITPGGGFAFNDSQFGRTLFYSTVPTSNGAAADTALATNGNIPSGLAADGNTFVVINSSTKTLNVTEIYPPRVVTPNFTLGGSACAANTIRKPTDVWLANGTMAVSDSLGHRVLIWYHTPTTANQAADAVLGQPNVTTCGNANLDATTVRSAESVWFNPNLTIAASVTDNRLSIWHNGPRALTSGQAADVVLGAPDKVTSGSGLATQTTFSPWKVISNGTQIFLVDANNNRVLVWNSIPQTDGAPADVVLGQAAFSSGSTSGTTQWSLNHPYGVGVTAASLIVNDHGAYRMLVFDGQ